MQKYVDILLVTETKVLLNGLSVRHGLDRNRNGGRIMIYVRDDIPSTLLVKHVLPGDIERLSIELNFRKLVGYYSEHITHHLTVTHAISVI